MKICNKFDKIVGNITKFEISDHRMDAILESLDGLTKTSDYGEIYRGCAG